MPSFGFPKAVRELHELTPRRLQLIQDATRERNRVEKLLEHVNVKIGNVLSDVFGVSGQSTLLAEPEQIAQLARGQAKRKIPHAKNGKILIPVSPRDSWFYRLAILDPASGRVTGIPITYVGDTINGDWAGDGRILAVGLPSRVIYGVSPRSRGETDPGHVTSGLRANRTLLPVAPTAVAMPPGTAGFGKMGLHWAAGFLQASFGHVMRHNEIPGQLMMFCGRPCERVGVEKEQDRLASLPRFGPLYDVFVSDSSPQKAEAEQKGLAWCQLFFCIG